MNSQSVAQQRALVFGGCERKDTGSRFEGVTLVAALLHQIRGGFASASTMRPRHWLKFFYRRVPIGRPLSLRRSLAIGTSAALVPSKRTGLEPETLSHFNLVCLARKPTQLF